MVTNGMKISELLSQAGYLYDALAYNAEEPRPEGLEGVAALLASDRLTISGLATIAAKIDAIDQSVLAKPPIERIDISAHTPTELMDFLLGKIDLPKKRADHG